MANKLNEFSLNLPIVSPETYGDTSQEGNFEEPEYQTDQTLQVSVNPEISPEDSLTTDYATEEYDLNDISVFANSISIVQSSNLEDKMVCFDINFMVSVTDGPENSGGYSSFQVIKRIAIDKLKIVKEAKQSASKVSVVEGKNTSTKKVIISEAKRFRILAGLE